MIDSARPSRTAARRGRRGRAALGLLLALALAVVSLPSPSGAVVGVDDQPGVLADFDSRAAVAPTDAQVAAANALADEVQWDKFGTPSSLVNHGGFLAENVPGKDATTAARAWLETNKSLYKLSSTDELEVATAGALAGTDEAYAVVFRQVIDGLSSADGAVSISLQKAGGSWNVVYASSTLTGEEAVVNEVRLAPAEALAEAASESGEDVSVAELDAQRVAVGLARVQGQGPQGRPGGPQGGLPHQQARCARRLRGHRDVGVSAGRGPAVPHDRRRRERQPADAPEPDRQRGRQPQVGRVPGVATDDQHQPAPVELPVGRRA